MKRQTFIAFLVDKDGVKRDFYRFSCKSVQTVEKQIRWAMKAKTGIDSLYRDTWIKDGVVACEIYETPDVVRDGEKPVMTIVMDWV